MGTRMGGKRSEGLSGLHDPAPLSSVFAQLSREGQASTKRPRHPGSPMQADTGTFPDTSGLGWARV